MSVEIPVSWLSYCDDNPSRGRWDQAFLARMLAGEEGRPPSGYSFVDTLWTPQDGRGRVVVFPAGHYAEHCGAKFTLDRLIDDLYKIDWAILIATSDECQTFPWYLVDPWPRHVQLWVQLPRVENVYPPGTRFIGEGSPRSAREIAALAAENWNKSIDVYFSGQMGHERREQMWVALNEIPAGNHVWSRTEGFTKGAPQEEYLRNLTQAWITPCPSGICSQSSFRYFEALEAQCIPLRDELRPGSDVTGFWDLIDPELPGFRIDNWDRLPTYVDTLVNAADRSLLAPVAAAMSARWQQYKRRLLNHLHDDVQVVAHHRPISCADDEITVIIPTSPVPSNPSLEIICETIASVRERLPKAEILITCDGVREEQADRRDAYHEYVRRLCAWTNSQFNVTPWVMSDHQHQSGMMRAILPEVRTGYLLYVEHDTPLAGEIDFAAVLAEMRASELASMRFYHDVAITAGSEHLFLGEPQGSHAPWLATLQWSQRPHLARVPWYRNLMATYFGSQSRTMIEDVMHGVVQHRVDFSADDGSDMAYPRGIRPAEAWKAWRTALYHPEGSIKRSSHLDARGDDPKYGMLIRYDGERPEGAPAEGWIG